MDVELTPMALSELQELPSPIVARVHDVVGRLVRWPETSGAKPMRRELKGNYRMRTGDYRVLFRVEGERIVIWRIAHRREVYE